jgi:hypothetical protein
LSLSGTSMAAPVVAGTAALMLQANPSLTPNAVKAILQYTAEERPGYDALTQGAGLLNAVGAVRLAQFFAAAEPGDAYPLQRMWSKTIIWGSHRLNGGVIDPRANAYATSTTWGTSGTSSGENIIWGTTCEDGCENLDNIIWGTSDSGNIIWGTSGENNIIWGTSTDGANIIWGTQVPDENIIWGTDCGGADCANIIWGTNGSGENIIWGTAVEGANIIWGTDCGGADCANIIWGTDEEIENIIWGTHAASDDDDDDDDDRTSSVSPQPVLLWDYYYSLYSRYLDSYSDRRFFNLVDALSTVLNPWRRATSEDD